MVCSLLFYDLQLRFLAAAFRVLCFQCKWGSSIHMLQLYECVFKLQLSLVAATNHLLPSAPMNFEMMAYVGYASWLNGVVRRFGITKAIQ